MKFRALAVTVAAAAAAAALTGPPALAEAPKPAEAPGITSTCASGQICVWSGANYTGQKVTFDASYPWGDCVTAASLGLPAIRSAKRNGVGCHMQAALHANGTCSSTEPEYVQTETPNVDPPALSLEQFLIPC